MDATVCTVELACPAFFSDCRMVQFYDLPVVSKLCIELDASSCTDGVSDVLYIKLSRESTKRQAKIAESRKLTGEMLAHYEQHD